MKQQINRFQLQSDYIPRTIEAHADACGKAIIVGEHAVVYGSRAIAMPLQVHRMSVRLRVGDEASKSVQFRISNHDVPAHVCEVVNDAFSALGIKPFNVKIEGSHSLPIGAGLGSSATLCIITLQAIAKAAQIDLSRDRLAFLANKLERRFHGNPSGLDTAVVAYEKVISFKKGPEIREIAMKKIHHDGPPCAWPFLIIDSGVRSSTLSMIQKAKPYFMGSDGEKVLQRFDDLTTKVESGLESGDPDLVAGGMNEAGQLLKAAGVVNDELRQLIDLCRDHGALAAKSTGAGGGGSIIALLNPHQQAQQKSKIGAALLRHGLQYFEVNLS